MSRSVLVIGGSGFIGSSLCRVLKSDPAYTFTILDKEISAFYPDVTQIADISFAINDKLAIGHDVIINLAAAHRDDISPLSIYSETNVSGAINICELANKSNINMIIFTSSVAVYGFAQIGANESSKIAPFNEYGRTKWEAEKIYTNWQAEDACNRTLVIIRPTVVFGERNRGNVFNLLSQIALRKFIMVGDGLNRKSIAYVENVAAFLRYSLDFKPGVHVYNYIDKPDLTMNALVDYVNKLLGVSASAKFRLPFSIGLLIGSFFDLVAKISGKKFPISAIRVKKFCANSVYESAIESTGFIPPVPLMKAIEKTVRFEFIEEHTTEQVFYSE